MISKVRGTQDFLDLTLFNFIIKTATDYFVCNNFTHIATPILERIELFKRTLGTETDVVTKQMFTIAAKEGQEELCLRPEATASTMRAFLEHRGSMQTPWRVFSYGPMFRHERPQKGRLRQFHQFNIEVIDTASIYQDAYFIALLDRLFQEHFKLDNYALALNFLGCPADRDHFKTILRDYLHKHGDTLCALCKYRKETNILRVFDCKNETCQEIYQQAPHITDYLCTLCAQEWQQLKGALDLLSICYTQMPTLVRGLDYYDKTVFEFISTALGSQTAFCAGGRYNHLAALLGSKKEVPALGASIGIERLLLLLEPIKNKLSLAHKPRIYAIAPLSDGQQDLALLIADQLQEYGLCIEPFLEGDSLKSMMRKANKMGAQAVIIVGSEEQQKGEVVIKNLQTGQEEKIKQGELLSNLNK